MVTSLGIMIPAIIFTCINVFKYDDTFGAANGDYRSKATGQWSSTSTWQVYNNGWVNASSVPSSSSGFINIQSGHTVTVNAALTVDQLTINSGGQLTITSSGNVTLANGGSTDLTVAGTLQNAGTITPAAGAVISVDGKYQHNYTTSAGTIPTATWGNGSTCEIIGYTNNSNAPAGIGQSFSNFTWNCTGQSQDINLNGGLTTVNGNLLIISTGSKELRQANANSTLTVGGNFTQSGGIFMMNDAGATVNINIGGDFSQSGGTLTTKSGSTGKFTFTKSGTQNYSQSGTVTNIDFEVKAGTGFDPGNSVMTGKSFTLNAGSTLYITSASGISASGGTGNIQVTDTRSFSKEANYIYDGTTAQVTGTGLPSTVNNLQINNSAGLTLSTSVEVAGRLMFTSGCITPGGKSLFVSNNSTAAISGHSQTSYVKGSIDRNVSSTGAYEFPIGTASNYELAIVTLNGATGFNKLSASFSSSAAVTALSVLTGIEINNYDISKILDMGYWSITPNTPMTGGTYTIDLRARGYSVTTGGKYFCVLKRETNLHKWKSLGTHSSSTQSVSGGTITAKRSDLTSFSDFAVAYGEYMRYEAPTLISGVDGEVGAVYRFSNVTEGVDTWLEILDLYGDATLSSVDQNSIGYNESWQPLIGVPGGKESYINWRVTFKKSTTTEDTTIRFVYLTAIDIDGNNNMQEFIEALDIYSYTTYPSTSLTISSSNGGYRAIAGKTEVSGIDSTYHPAIVQMNYRDINTFTYKTGIVATGSSSVVRQFSLFFTYFTSGNTALPIELINFNAFAANGRVDLKWATAAEKNNDFFTIERSIDGHNFEKILTLPGAGNSVVVRNYSASDNNPVKGKAYYRLKQTDFNGEFSYSEIRMVNYDDAQTESHITIKSVNPSAFTDHFTVNYSCKEAGPAEFMITSVNGQVIEKRSLEMEEGNNYIDWSQSGEMPKGIYFVVIYAGNEKSVMKVVKQ